MSTQRLGIRQRQLIEAMKRYGHGTYPPHWRMGHDKMLVLESLERHGIVTKVLHSSGKQIYQLVNN